MMAAMSNTVPRHATFPEVAGDHGSPENPLTGSQQDGEEQECPSKVLDTPCLTCGSPGGSNSIFTRVGNSEPLLTLLSLMLRRPVGDLNLYTDVVCASCFSRFQVAQRLLTRLTEVARQVVLSFNRAAKQFSKTTTAGEEEPEEECLLVLNGVKVDVSEGGIVGRALSMASSSRRARGAAKVKPERKFVCPVCGKKFYAYSHRVEHMLVHTGERAFRCAECGYLATTKSNLARHQQRHNQECQCQECGKTLANKFSLKEHQKTHLGDRPHRCQHCDKTFLRRRELRIHERTHGTVQGQEAHECQVCHKTFVLRSRLARHMLVHSEDKQFVCTICGKEFVRKDDLKCHERVHTGEKPYTCERCGKAFSYVSNCRSHMRVHMKEASKLRCVCCDMTFPTQGKLNTHLKSRNHRRKCEGEGTGRVTCEGCGAILTLGEYASHRVRCVRGKEGETSLRSEDNQYGVCGVTFKGTRELSEHSLTSHTAAAPPSSAPNTPIIISGVEVGGEGGLVSLAELDGVNVVVMRGEESPLQLPLPHPSTPNSTTALLADEGIIEEPPAPSPTLLPLGIGGKDNGNMEGNTILATFTGGEGMVMCGGEEEDPTTHHAITTTPITSPPPPPPPPPQPSTVTILNPPPVFKLADWDLNDYYQKT